MIDQFKVLRHVPVAKLSPEATSYLVEEYKRRKISIDPMTNKPRADVIDPATGWVDNDIPRDEHITVELQELGNDRFAIAHAWGGIISGAEFKTVKAAEKARANYKPKFEYSFEDVTNEDEEEAVTLSRKR